jgi:hypothetical protein
MTTKLPYEGSTSGEKALGEIQKILRSYGCNKFGSMVDDAEQTILVQFEWRGRQVSVKASMRGYAAAYMKAHPPVIYNTDINSGRAADKRRAAERKAADIASVAVYSILRDWIKGQITAVETGILSFEGAFMGQIMLPGKGKTIEEFVTSQNLLPKLEGPTS